MECLMPHKEFCSKQRLVTIFQIDFARHTMLKKLIFAKKKVLDENLWLVLCWYFSVFLAKIHEFLDKYGLLE